MKSVFGCVLLLAALAANSFACLWSGTAAPPCAVWTRADAVFLGKVLKIENASKSEDLPAGARKIRFQVLENFKGADNPTFALFETEWETGCDENPKKGETWIIYARNDIVVKSFTRLRALKTDPKQTSEELQTLKNIIAGKTATAILGQIVSQSQKGKYIYEPVAITVEGGGKRIAVQTDENGAFEIPVLSDGTYKIELKFPYRASFKWDENLLGTSLAEGVPTLFKYEARLNDGDCHFSFFEVLKK